MTTSTGTTYHGCSERVYPSGYSVSGTRCSRPGTVEREVMKTVKVAEARIDKTAVYEGGEPERVEPRFEERPVKVWFCSTHDPVKVSERRAKKDDADRRERDKVLSDDSRCRSMAEEAARKLKEHFGVEVGVEYQRKEYGAGKGRHYPTGRVVVSVMAVDRIIAAFTKEAK